MEKLKDLLDVQALATGLVGFLPDLFVALLFVLGFWLGFRISRKPLTSAFRRAGLDETLIRLLVDNVYRTVMLAFGFVMAADQLGINVAAALAGIGVVGIALGFAAQDSVANMISGFLIFWDKPFRVGDWIELGDEYGRVQEITLRSTRIRTVQNNYVVVPNKKIIDDVLVNHSKNGESRIDVPVGIAYKEDIQQAREVILAAIEGMEGILEDPASVVVVEGLGDSSVNLSVRVWTDDVSREAGIYVAVVEAAKLALDAADIEIPFPHLQLFMDTVEDRVWDGAENLVRLKRGKGASA